MAVKASKVEQNPTRPFSDEEVDRILVAARAPTGFSGLRMQDAACLERERLGQ